MSILGRLAQLSPMIDGIMLPPRRTPTSEPEANFEEPTVENLERLKQQSAGAAAVETTEPAFTPPVTTVPPVEEADEEADEDGLIDPLAAEKAALEEERKRLEEERRRSEEEEKPTCAICLEEISANTGDRSTWPVSRSTSWGRFESPWMANR